MRTAWVKSIILLCALGDSAVSGPAGHNRPIANTDSGLVVGVRKDVLDSPKKLDVYLGVPFGAPTERFSPPVSPKPFTEPFDASAYGPSCPQQFNYPEARRSLIIQWFNTPPPPSESEDCLNLNVYVPVSKKKGKPKAVMVWIYGGGLLYGSNSNTKYDGSDLAASEDVVVVVINYRTNVFGFPASPQLPVTERNLGFLDQRLALDWVQRNIAAFGGDPDRVTIFGESAGALSVDALLTAPPDPLPFQAAIMESGTATFRGRTETPALAWEILVAALGCNSSTVDADILACMRAVPVNEVLNYTQHNRLGWAVTFDNVTSADLARSDRFSSTPEASKIARVPILGGSNAHEGRLYSFSAINATSFIRGLFPLATDDEIFSLLGNYTGYENEFQQLAALYTDFVFQCPARLVHLETVAVGIPSYRYYYNASFPNTDIFNDSGVYHASEIQTVLGTYPQDGATPFQEELSAYIQKVWANFAKDPWGKGAPPWPQGSEAMGELGGGVRAEDGQEGRGELLTILSTEETDYVDRNCGLYQAVYDFLGR